MVRPVTKELQLQHGFSMCSCGTVHYNWPQLNLQFTNITTNKYNNKQVQVQQQQFLGWCGECAGIFQSLKWVIKRIVQKCSMVDSCKKVALTVITSGCTIVTFGFIITHYSPAKCQCLSSLWWRMSSNQIKVAVTKVTK